jgi:ring-1,2-phenylacetyl-CoA epoxidase subunit PaaC
MQELDQQFHDPIVNVLLCVADDKLFLGHKNSDWTGLAPILEADIAFSSLSQDDIAHASAFYELIQTITGQNPDQIAFSRNANEYLCADIVTKDDSFNWANAIARQFYCNVYEYYRLQRLSTASWTPLASLAKRIFAEQVIHVDHVTSWIKHLGKGSGDSNSRMQQALDTYAPFASMLFEAPEGIETLFEGKIISDDGCMFTEWKEHVDQVTNEAGLTATVAPASGVGGRRGSHGAEFKESLCELQEVFSTDPLAAW